ncbi:MAG TPA: hypothetical protein VJ022_01380 [Anaerolineales bacterium]|nr:hypothetical protein [Anaerolineales bacterium]
MHHPDVVLPVFAGEFQLKIYYIASIFKLFRVPCHGLQDAPAQVSFFRLQVRACQWLPATIAEEG